MISSIDPSRGDCITDSLRNSDRISLHKSRTERGKLPFSYQAVKDFNNLDKEIRATKSVITFYQQTNSESATLNIHI